MENKCPTGLSVKCLEKFNHVGAILLALEDFNRKNLKTLVEPLTCTSQLSKQPHPRCTGSEVVTKVECSS